MRIIEDEGLIDNTVAMGERLMAYRENTTSGRRRRP
jgi:hypothetical protein